MNLISDNLMLQRIISIRLLLVSTNTLKMKYKTFIQNNYIITFKLEINIYMKPNTRIGKNIKTENMYSN